MNLDSDTAVRSLCERLTPVQSRARQRLLAFGAVAVFVALCRRAVKAAALLDIPAEQIRVYVDGGAVPNSYRYRADTTYLALVDGEVLCGRTWARTVSYGDQGRADCQVRAVKAEHPELAARLKAAGFRGHAGTFDIDAATLARLVEERRQEKARAPRNAALSNRRIAL